MTHFNDSWGHICHSKGHANIDHTNMAMGISQDASETFYHGDPCIIHAHDMGRDHNGHLQQKQTKRRVICIFRFFYNIF